MARASYVYTVMTFDDELDQWIPEYPFTVKKEMISHLLYMSSKEDISGKVQVWRQADAPREVQHPVRLDVSELLNLG